MSRYKNTIKLNNLRCDHDGYGDRNSGHNGDGEIDAYGINHVDMMTEDFS